MHISLYVLIDVILVIRALTFISLHYVSNDVRNHKNMFVKL